MSCILFIAKGFNIVPIAPNTIQYIWKIFLTSDGTNTTTTGISLDGANGNGYFAGTITGTKICLAGDICRTTRPTSWWGSVGATWAQWVTWATGNTWGVWPSWATWAQWNTWVKGDTWFLQAGDQWATPFWSGSDWITKNTNIFNLWSDVGIGTTNPLYKLDVNGNGRFQGLCLEGNKCIYTWPSAGGESLWLTWVSAWKIDSNIYYNSWNVGIGTDAPATKLQVDGGGGTIKVIPGLTSSLININNTLRIGSTDWTITDGSVVAGVVPEWMFWVVWNNNGNLLLSASNASQPSDDLVITTAGRVGIGTSSPLANLHVVGNGKFTNSVQVGAPETSRCSTTADAGKITYTTQCSIPPACTRVAALVWCMQNGLGTVLATGIIITTRSDSSCPWDCSSL